MNGMSIVAAIDRTSGAAGNPLLLSNAPSEDPSASIVSQRSTMGIGDAIDISIGPENDSQTSIRKDSSVADPKTRLGTLPSNAKLRDISMTRVTRRRTDNMDTTIRTMRSAGPVMKGKP
jgi:hypothetical protein